MTKIPPFFLLLLVALMSGCSRSSSVDTDRLADAYVGVSLLQEQYRRSDSTETTQQHEQQIKATLATFQMTPDEFRSNFETVSKSQEKLSQFYERVNKKLLERKK